MVPTDEETMTTSNWNLDQAHSSINFSVRHKVVSKVRGRFAKFSGTLDIDEGDITRSVDDATIEYGGRGKDPWGNERVGFVAKTNLDRKDFGLEWNQALEAGGVLVGDRVDIELDLQGVSAAAANAA